MVGRVEIGYRKYVIEAFWILFSCLETCESILGSNERKQNINGKHISYRVGVRRMDRERLYVAGLSDKSVCAFWEKNV